MSVEQFRAPSTAQARAAFADNYDLLLEQAIADLQSKDYESEVLGALIEAQAATEIRFKRSRRAARLASIGSSLAYLAVGAALTFSANLAFDEGTTAAGIVSVVGALVSAVLATLFGFYFGRKSERDSRMLELHQSSGNDAEGDVAHAIEALRLIRMIEKRHD